MKRILLYLFAASFSFVAQGQQPIDKQVQVKNLSIEKTDDGNLQVKATIILNKAFSVATNQGATITPILRNEEYVKELPSAIIYGRKRAILSRRNNRTPMNTHTVIRRNKGKKQAIDYKTSLPYQAWMSTSDLLLVIDLCGCGNATEEVHEQLLASVPTFEPAPIVKEAIAEVVPPKKVYKKRVKEGDGNLFFPVNNTTIYPDYMDNPEELKKIRTLIEDDDIKYITHIAIHAYASPEGNYANNVRLAEGRASSLKKYLAEHYQFADSIITTKSTPEDWEGFRKQIVASDLDNKTAILSIIDNDAEPDVKEKQLKALKSTYTHIHRVLFPALRHLRYTVEYLIPEESEKTE